MAGREVAGIANADADLFRNAPYALVGEASTEREPFVSAFLKILEKIGARPLWLGAQQHDYAVGLASHYVPEPAYERLQKGFAALPAPAQGALLFAVAVLLHEAASTTTVPFVYFQF